jgi:hypothetical protein
MGEVSLVRQFKVNIIESERGWGSKIDDTKYFDSEESAKAFVKEYNDKYNSQPGVPDWYMVAEYAGELR